MLLIVDEEKHSLTNFMVKLKLKSKMTNGNVDFNFGLTFKHEVCERINNDE